MRDYYGEVNDSRLKKVQYIVFGDSYKFWVEYHNLLKIPSQGEPGLVIKYYRFTKDKECVACLWFKPVEDIYTVFVDPCGAYQNYPKLEEFVFKLCGMKRNPDNHCDDSNFYHHIALHNMDSKERTKRLINKYTLDLQEAARQLEYYKNQLIK